MSRHIAWRLAAAGLLLFALAPLAHAVGEGQADLDQATDLKLTAETLDDLDKVVELCESALAKGLDDAGQAFAKQLLTSTLYQHAERLAEPIFGQQPPHPRWPLLRQFAARDLEKALTHNPAMGEAHLLLARLLALPGGNQEQAAASAKKAVELLRKQEDRFLLARALTTRAAITGTVDERLADLNEALKLNPNEIDALRTRGLLELATGKHAEALADLEKVLEKNPEDIAAWQAAAEVLINLDKLGDALTHINKALEQNPRLPLAYGLRARIHVLQGENEAAIGDLDEALKLDPRSVAALLLRAQLHTQAEQHDKATADIERALQIRPGLTQALLLKVMNAAAAGKFGQAIVDLEKLIAADPGNLGWRLQLGSLYLADKRPRRAIEIFSKVLEDDAENWQALRSRGDTHLNIGQHAEAIRDLEAALKLQPDHPGILNNLSWVLSTSPDDKLRNGARALELGKKAVEVTEAKQAHILSTLAAAHAELGQWEEARKWAAKAVEAGNDDAQGQLEEELESYKKEKPWREKQEQEENAEPLERPKSTFEL